MKNNETILQGSNNMPTLDAIHTQLQDIQRTLDEQPAAILLTVNQAIKEKNLISAEALDRRLEQFSPTADIDMLLKNALESQTQAITKQLGVYADAIEKRTLAQQAQLDHHQQLIDRNTDDDGKQQQQIADLSAIVKLLAENEPKIMKQAELDRAEVIGLRQQYISIEKDYQKLANDVALSRKETETIKLELSVARTNAIQLDLWQTNHDNAAKAEKKRKIERNAQWVKYGWKALYALLGGSGLTGIAALIDNVIKGM